VLTCMRIEYVRIKPLQYPVPTIRSPETNNKSSNGIQHVSRPYHFRPLRAESLAPSPSEYDVTPADPLRNPSPSAEFLAHIIPPPLLTFSLPLTPSIPTVHPFPSRRHPSRNHAPAPTNIHKSLLQRSRNNYTSVGNQDAT
jgi:hypothetical protein